VDDAWVTNIMAFVDVRLLYNCRQTTIESLWNEVRDDYLTSITKAIVNFVLKDESKGNPDAPEPHGDGGSGTGAAPSKSEGGPLGTGLKRNMSSVDLHMVPKPSLGRHACGSPGLDGRLSRSTLTTRRCSWCSTVVPL
jgi:hypothetical protein